MLTWLPAYWGSSITGRNLYRWEESSPWCHIPGNAVTLYAFSYYFVSVFILIFYLINCYCREHYGSISCVPYHVYTECGALDVERKRGVILHSSGLTGGYRLMICRLWSGVSSWECWMFHVEKKWVVILHPRALAGGYLLIPCRLCSGVSSWGEQVFHLLVMVTESITKDICHFECTVVFSYAGLYIHITYGLFMIRVIIVLFLYMYCKCFWLRCTYCFPLTVFISWVLQQSHRIVKV